MDVTFDAEKDVTVYLSDRNIIPQTNIAPRKIVILETILIYYISWAIFDLLL